MIKYVIKDNWINWAHLKHTGKPYNSNTIVKNGRGQITGTLGEMAFGRWLTDLDIDFDYVADRSYDCDFIVGDYRIDVKSKKSIGPPRPDYVERIPFSQQRQNCNIYVFTYVTDAEVYLVGYCNKDDFWYEISRSVKAGDHSGNHVEKSDANLAYLRDLTNLDRLELIFSDF